MERLNLQKLIGDITPLYNSYKESSKTIDGVSALHIMWRIGDLLTREIEFSGVAPHSLYRKIYGKGEGSKDIVQKSYITREFLSRAYRIRKIFKWEKDIEKDLPTLKSFILFREAMPFFDNDKYALKGKEKDELLNILNSKLSAAIILKKIKILQKEKIGKKNPRNQKLNELEPQKEVFINFYNFLFSLIKNNSYNSIKDEIGAFSKFLPILSSNTSALAEEGYLYTEIPKFPPSTEWGAYGEMLTDLSKKVDAKERRRFRRLISPERIVRLAEMIQALSSEASFKNFKR